MKKKEEYREVREYHGELPEELLELYRNAPLAEEVVARMAANPLDLDHDDEWVAEYMKLEIVHQVLEAMEAQGINRNQLAERLGKSRQWVSRVLNETDNFTVATIARLAIALEMRPTVKFTPLASEKAELDPHADNVAEPSGVYTKKKKAKPKTPRPKKGSK